MLCPRGTPYVFGGAERLWHGTVDAINRLTDHHAEIVELTAPESSFADIVRSYANFDALTLDEFDVVITGKYPAWMVRHPRHVVYMCHPLRGLYDTYGAGQPRGARPESLLGRELQHTVTHARPGSDSARHDVLTLAQSMVDELRTTHRDLDFPGPLIRELVHWLDADALHPDRVKRHIAISRTVADRPGYFPSSAEVAVVVPPSGLDGLHEGEFGSFFTASRLDDPKRIDLLIRAMQHLPSFVRLRIAGAGPAHTSLWALANGDPRITFLGRVSDDVLVEEYASALAVPFVPEHEDLGLVTLEAQLSGKPVITCVDSGGVAELVQDGVDGFVVEPTPQALATSMYALAADPELARSLGAHGKRRAQNVTWQRVVDALLAEKPTRTSGRGTRARIVALSTYAASPAEHGGQVRINRLYSALASEHDVHLIAIGDGRSSSCEVVPGFTQTVVEMSQQYHHLTSALTDQVGTHTGDVVATLTAETCEQFANVVLAALETADAVILPHPYLYPFVRSAIGSIPLIYDSHNAEWRLKSSMYSAGPVALALATAVAAVERDVLRHAHLVTATSDDDVADLRSLTTTMAQFEVIPNGGDFSSTPFVTRAERRQLRGEYLDALHRTHIARATRHVATFIGSGHGPNIDAAHVVLEAAARLPDVLFLLLGSHVHGLKGAPTGPNVIARGIVDRDELLLLLSLTTVAVNPMATGSGSNIKMLDYFATGAPTISSSIGARGLPVEHGRDLLIEDSDLARAIREVIDDPGAADERADRARSVAAPFDWGVLGHRLLDLINVVIGDDSH